MTGGGVYEERKDDIATQKIYEKCENKGCRTFINGKMYVCGKAYSINEIYNTKSRYFADELDIRFIRKNIIARYFVKIFYFLFIKRLSKFKEQCRYCKISEENIPAAIQLNPDELKKFRKVTN